MTSRATRAAAPALSAHQAARRRAEWIATAALVALAALLSARGLVLGFVGDDFALLDAALRVPLGELLTGRHGILGYYRPISRELYFWWWGRVLGLGAGGFHLVNALTFAATAVMLAGVGRALAGSRAGCLAAALLVVFPAGSALLAWVSCAQDLIALFWSAAALLLYVRGRTALAGVAVALAALSKETAAVLPAAIVALDWRLEPRATPTERWRRLVPTALGLASAIVLSILARSTWTPGTAISVWSPKQIVGAWHLPFDLVRTYVPPDIATGLGEVFGFQPVFPIVLIGLAALAAWPLGAGANHPDHHPGASAHETAGGGTAPRRETRGPVPPLVSAERDTPRRRAGPDTRTAVIVGLTLAIAAMLPVGFIVERWRSYFFSLSALGVSLAGGALLAAGPPWLARTVIAIGALIQFGAGSVYRPIESRSGPARHPFVNYAFFRDTGGLTTQLLQALEPWCEALRAVPRTFAAGVPPDATFESVLGPGLRVTCRDTVSRVRFLADFTPADAVRDFGVLHFDGRQMRFALERADARVRARIGEGFLVHARYDVAAACFEAAGRGQAPDRELSYPLVLATAADGRAGAAESTWRAWSAAGATPNPTVMTIRLLAAGGTNAAPDSVRTLLPLVSGALAAPWMPAPHRALGAALLERGRVREAAIEWSAAAGISREAGDLARLGEVFEAMGATDEALAAYRRALTLGLPRGVYESVRDRFIALDRRASAGLDRSQTRP